MAQLPTTSPELAAAGRPPAITLRSVALGLLTAFVICAFTPYNDYALNNTTFVGNSLPLGLTMLTFIFVVIINGPLNRLAPRFALGTGELTVAFSMALVSCALPSAGLMRYLVPTLVSPLWQGQANANYYNLLKSLDLPDWLLPTFFSSELAAQVNDPVVTGYMARWIGDGPPPYDAWITPMFAWAIFIFAFFGAILCMVAIVHRQWYENERLPFPLAEIQLALVQAPQPGRLLNDILRSRALWIALVAVFFLRSINGAAEYWPKIFPAIPVGYEMRALFSEPPLSYATRYFQSASIFFIAVGVTFFLSSTVAISLWAFMLIGQVHRMLLGSATGDPTNHGGLDQHLGGVLAMAVMILWIGRRHWRTVLAQAFRGPRPDEPQGSYLSYRFAFWMLLACAAVMVLWLHAAGSDVLPAVVMVALLLLLFLIITRIVAETGMVHSGLLVAIYKPWQLLAHYTPFRVPVQTFYMGGMLQTIFYDLREPMSVYASHSVKLADQARIAPDDAAGRRRGRALFALLFLALAVGYFTSFISTLRTEYAVAISYDTAEVSPINPWGASGVQRAYLLEPTLAYQRDPAVQTHSPAGHLVTGFLITTGLYALRLTYAWWPLHPVGYIMMPTHALGMLWFSVFIGWLCKSLIVRFGGAALYKSAKPFFLGLILGEALAAGFWLSASVILHWLHIPYHTVNFVPR